MLNDVKIFVMYLYSEDSSVYAGMANTGNSRSKENERGSMMSELGPVLEADPLWHPSAYFPRRHPLPHDFFTYIFDIFPLILQDKRVFQI